MLPPFPPFPPFPPPPPILETTEGEALYCEEEMLPPEEEDISETRLGSLDLPDSAAAAA